MKKLIALLTIFACVLGLIACSVNDTDNTAQQTGKSNTASNLEISSDHTTVINRSQTENAKITSLTIPEKVEILANGYPTNKHGETYGPDIWEFDYSPDLVLVQNKDGVLGYIRVSELEKNPPNSPSDLDGYEQVYALNMYLEDGITIIGEFRLN